MAIEVESPAAQWVARLLQAKSPAPDRAAVTEGGLGRWSSSTYGQLRRRTAGLRGLLQSAIQPGERVIIAAAPSADWVVGFLATVEAGAIAVLVDPQSTEAELTAQLELTHPVAVVLGGPATAPIRARLARVAPGLRLIDAGASHPCGDVQRARGSITDIAVILPTSGTTGKPKGVALTLANLDYMVETLCELQRPSDDDVWLSLLPLSHLLEVACALLPALRSGGRVCFTDSIDANALLHIMVEQDVSKMMTVPALLQALRRRALAGPVPLPPRLKVLYCGGAPLDLDTASYFAELGITIYSGYGLTETGPTVSVNHPRGDRPGSVGRPIPGTAARSDPNTGEILVRGPGVMAGYWNDERLTGNAFDGAWLRTGDLGHLDDDGYLHITGRLKNLIVLPSGLKVQPEEVEAAIVASDLVADVCVTGRDRVTAVVHPRATAGAEASRQELEAEIRDRCAGLSPHKWPTRIVITAEPLPKTRKQSVLRSAVATMADGMVGP